MTTIDVSGCVFLLVSAYPGCPGQNPESSIITVVVVVVVCILLVLSLWSKWSVLVSSYGNCNCWSGNGQLHAVESTQSGEFNKVDLKFCLKYM